MRILLADDHHMVREGLRALLENVLHVEVVAECGDGREALQAIDRLRPDVALLDITMPGMNGIEVAARVRDLSPRTRVVMLSMHASEVHVAQALRAGVSGYLLKGARAAELRMALEAVHRGETWLSPAISRQVVDGFLKTAEAEADPLAGLTTRQREILQLIAEGRSNKEMAELLGVSVKTVEMHRTQLMERVGIHDVPGLVRLAIRAGLISPER